MNLVLFTTLSQASAHGCSQLEHQKLGVSSCTEEVLKQFNYPHGSAHPGATALSLCPYFIFQPNEASAAVAKAVLCYKMDEPAVSMPRLGSAQCLPYVNIVLLGKNAVDEATTSMCKPYWLMLWHLNGSSEWLQLCTWAWRQYKWWVKAKILHGRRLWYNSL